MGDSSNFLISVDVWNLSMGTAFFFFSFAVLLSICSFGHCSAIEVDDNIISYKIKSLSIVIWDLRIFS